MGDLKGAPAVHFNLPLRSFYITYKTGNAAAGEPIPSEYGRFGEWVWPLLLLETVFVCLLIYCEETVQFMHFVPVLPRHRVHTVQNGVLPSRKCTVCTVCRCFFSA